MQLSGNEGHPQELLVCVCCAYHPSCMTVQHVTLVPCENFTAIYTDLKGWALPEMKLIQ